MPCGLFKTEGEKRVAELVDVHADDHVASGPGRGSRLRRGRLSRHPCEYDGLLRHADRLCRRSRVMGCDD
jgi:hypothetical protein